MRRSQEFDQELAPINAYSLHVLIALAAGPCPGYSIQGRVVAATVGGATIGKSTIYATLRRLEAEGLVESEDPIVSHSGRMITCYSLTHEGWERLRQEERRLGTLHRAVRQRLLEYEYLATNVI